MSETIIGIIGIGVLVVLILGGMHIGLAMMLVGFVGYAAVAGWQPAFGILQTVPFTTVGNYGMAVIPLFLLMGEAAFAAGMSDGLYDFARKWLGRIPGGLCAATFAACAGFAAICGSTTATAATMATVALPEMRKSGYHPGLAAGSLAVGGTLGILIPPSAGFIVYGIVTGQSIGRLFAAGVIPGILLTILLILSVAIRAKISPDIAPPIGRASWRERFASLPQVLPVLLLFAFVIGGIFSGLFTATEAAAAGAFVSFVYLAARRRLNWRTLQHILVNSILTSCMVFLILVGAYVFGYFLTVTRIPMTLSTAIIGLSLNKYLVFALIVIIYLILGCLMDSLAMITLTVPIFLPLMQDLGFDPIWFGVIAILVMEMGLVTPPVGLNVYVIAGMARDIDMGTIFRGAIPFVLTILLCVIILTAFPTIATWLPSVLYG